MSTSPDRDHLLARISAIFASLHTSLNTLTPLTLPLVSRRTSPPTPLTLTFPGRTPAQAWRFTLHLHLLSLIHHLLLTNQTTTKRDIFYRHVPLFRTQAAVDKAVDDLAATLSVPRSSLNILAASKGLVCSPSLTLTLTVGSPIVCATPTLIPPRSALHAVELAPHATCVLLVEKEAIFQRLCSALPSAVVAVTGKGYPDVATRELLVELAGRAGVNVVALVDLDPHGVDIMATVRFGSKAMAHEGEALRVGVLQWVGVGFDDLGAAGEQELLRMTVRDRGKAVEMLARAYMEEVPEWRSALQRMLFTGVKAEIEILGDGLLQWVENMVSEL